MSKIILGDNSEQFEQTDQHINEKRVYLNSLKENFQERTSQLKSSKNDTGEIDLTKELKSDLKEIKTNLNLFQGRTEAEKGSAKFPDWDIVPPNQFINPRIKKQ